MGGDHVMGGDQVMGALTREQTFAAFKEAWDKAFSDADLDKTRWEIIESLRGDLRKHLKLLTHAHGALAPGNETLAAQIEKLLRKSKERGL